MEPSGLRMVTVTYPLLELATFMLTRWFSVPSNSTIPILPAVLMVTALGTPNCTRPVNPTSEGVYGAGGMKKSFALTALP